MTSQISVEYVKAHQHTRLREAAQARLARQARAGRTADSPRLPGAVLSMLSMMLHRAPWGQQEQQAQVGTLPR